MAGIDPNRAFLPLRCVILTISDTRTRRDDHSGDLLAERAATAGHIIVEREIVPDEQPIIEQRLRTWAEQVDVVLTTGGTGVTARDVTPEAVHAVCSKHIPGFGELFRYVSMRHIGTSTIQSRATAAVVGGAYVFALPGSTGACRDAWDEILVHQLDSRHRPCNFAELLPRVRGETDRDGP